MSYLCQIDSRKVLGLKQVDPTDRGLKSHCHGNSCDPSIFSLSPTREYLEVGIGKGEKVGDRQDCLFLFQALDLEEQQKEWSALLSTAGPQKHRASLCWRARNRYKIHRVEDLNFEWTNF